MLSVGLIPENELSKKAGVKLDPRTRGAFVKDNLETSVPGIFACGNVLQVHDLVDNVSAEGEKAGKNAALYIKEGERKGEIVTAVVGDGISYLCPQQISLADDQKVELCFRVRKPVDRSRVLVYADGELVKKVEKLKMIPSEMEKLPIDKKLLDGKKEVKVTVEGGSITDISIVSAEKEDGAYLSMAEDIIPTIIDAQSADVDTISGATFSSTGIKNAVAQALEEAAK